MIKTKFVFIFSLMTVIFVGVAHADIASTTYASNATNLTSGTVAAARLPVATKSAAGAVKVGTNLSVSSGIISVASANRTTAGIAKMGEIPVGTTGTETAMIWVE